MVFAGGVQTSTYNAFISPHIPFRGSTRIALQVCKEEKLMRNSNFRMFWIPAFLLAAVVAGCGDADKGPPGATSPFSPPTVVSVTPPDGSTIVCPNTAVITATFSKAMNPTGGDCLHRCR